MGNIHCDRSRGTVGHDYFVELFVVMQICYLKIVDQNFTIDS